MKNLIKKFLILCSFLFIAKISLAAVDLVQNADINKNHSVDLSDYSILLTDFGKKGVDLDADIDQDENVGLSDFSILLSYFGQSTQSNQSTLHTENFILVYKEKIRSNNETLPSGSSYAFYVDVTTPDNKPLESLAELELHKIIQGQDILIHTSHVMPPGRYGLTINDNLIGQQENFPREINLPVTFELRYGQEVLEKMNFNIEKSISNPGLGTIHLQAFSNTSNSENLDRVLITGADILIYRQNAQEPLYQQKTTSGGFLKLLDIDPGLYEMQGKYKGTQSSRIAFEVTAEGITSKSIIIPIEPSGVDIIPGTVFGLIQKTEVDYYRNQGAEGIVVKLFEADGLLSRNPVKEIGQTTTDAYGLYQFENVPGNKNYFVDFEPYPGWRTVYPKESYMLSQPLASGGELNFWHNIWDRP